MEAHDDVLRSAVERHAGWLFKHTGDGVCAAFSVAGDAVAAAVDAQQRLGLAVRMGIGTGTAEVHGDDYFGPPLNRAARVMAAGHGGQILVAASTAALLDGVDLWDLGEHRLRDLPGVHRLFQVRADGLRETFPALRTADPVPGNLPVEATSFVGRDREVTELTELVRSHRMVTLTGVGGVGKTRLALQVAAASAGEFVDGVWLVELASVAEPGAVGDVVATALGVTPQRGMSVAARIAEALSGRRLLVVLDNCEHVLDAAAAVGETLLARTATVNLLATSREGLRVPAERLWPVPPLDVAGPDAAAVELFLDRARAVNPGLALRSDDDITAVTEICTRLDGIALGIELAAARLVSMTPQDVRDRLGDRFRLLSGPRRGMQRHQTLRQAVQWSYDLLGEDERELLNGCSVFAGGFDLVAAAHISGVDELLVLDGLDSLVRKSLVTAEQVRVHVRYGLLETIRQFAGEQLEVTGSLDDVRRRHAAYYAEQAVVHWELWDGPDQQVAVDWVDSELANLRAAFRWATDQSEVATAATIAAHAAMLGQGQQRFEPVGWCEEVIPVAEEAHVAHLCRLYTSASLCMYIGRPDDAVAYAVAAGELAADPAADPFPHGLNLYWEATAHTYAGRFERAEEIFAGLAARRDPGHVYGRCAHIRLLVLLGRGDEAVALADETLAAASAHANPYFVAMALWACGLAFGKPDPARALESFHQGHSYAREHRLAFWAAHIAAGGRPLGGRAGDLARGLELYEGAIDAFHQSGNLNDLAHTFESLALSFERHGRSEVAATLYGTAARFHTTTRGFHPDRVRATLGDAQFERCAAVGAAMDPGEATMYAREQIGLARRADDVAAEA